MGLRRLSCGLIASSPSTTNWSWRPGIISSNQFSHLSDRSNIFKHNIGDAEGQACIGLKLIGSSGKKTWGGNGGIACWDVFMVGEVAFLMAKVQKWVLCPQELFLCSGQHKIGLALAIVRWPASHLCKHLFSPGRRNCMHNAQKTAFKFLLLVVKHFATLMQIYEPWKGPYGGRNWCPHNSNEGSPHPPPPTSQYCPLTSHSIHLCTELHEELTRSDLLLHFVWKVYLQCGNKWWPGVIFAPYWHFLFNWHLSWLGKKYFRSFALLHWDWLLLYFWPLQMSIFAEEWSTKIHICTNWSDVAKKWMWELSIINLPRTCGNRMGSR